MLPAGLRRDPDPLAEWIRLDLMTRKVIGWRMKHGPTLETDAALDRLIALRARVARRLVN